LGVSILHIQDHFIEAIKANSLMALKAAYEQGADPAAFSNVALIDASEAGHLDIVNYLLTFDEVVKIIDANSHGALKVAARNRHLAVAYRLLEVYYLHNIPFPNFINNEERLKTYARSIIAESKEICPSPNLVTHLFRHGKFLSNRQNANDVAPIIDMFLDGDIKVPSLENKDVEVSMAPALKLLR
jgi:hypothetical protein